MDTVQIIKVKLHGRYRKCQLLNAHRSKTTGELGYVDIRVLAQERVTGVQDYYWTLPVSYVRKSDHTICAGMLRSKSTPSAL